MEGGKSKQNKERGTGFEKLLMTNGKKMLDILHDMQENVDVRTWETRVDICPLEGEIPTESRTFLSGKDKRDWFNK